MLLVVDSFVLTDPSLRFEAVISLFASTRVEVAFHHDGTDGRYESERPPLEPEPAPTVILEVLKAELLLKEVKSMSEPSVFQSRIDEALFSQLRPAVVKSADLLLRAVKRAFRSVVLFPVPRTEIGTPSIENDVVAPLGKEIDERSAIEVSDNALSPLAPASLVMDIVDSP